MFERPGVLSVGDQVVFGAAVHTVVAISGSSRRLRSCGARWVICPGMPTQNDVPAGP